MLIMSLKDKKISLELPSFGKKHFKPSESAEQEKQIENSIAHIKHIISYKPVKLLNSLSKAVWLPEIQLAEVAYQTGSHWGYIGHQIGSKLYIYPEEALFLLETGCLDLFYNNLPLSVQRAYSLLLSSQNNITIEQYRVYSHLSNLGYKVRRHSPQNSVTKYEKDLQLYKLNQSCSKPQTNKRVHNFDDNGKSSKKKLKKDEKKTFSDSCKEDCDIKETLRKLQIFQTCDDNVETSLNFDFDVYMESFKKSSIFLPNFRVVIHRSEDTVPDFKDIRSLNYKYKDGVPVIQAVVFSDYIAFCEINAAMIPDILE